MNSLFETDIKILMRIGMVKVAKLKYPLDTILENY